MTHPSGRIGRRRDYSKQSIGMTTFCVSGLRMNSTSRSMSWTFALWCWKKNPGGVLQPLKDPERFKQVRGNYALIWPNPDTGACDEQAIDMAPECVRFFCERYGMPLKVPKRAKDQSRRYPSYWVAYFDLLGFKSMVQQRTIWEVHDCYAAVLEEIRKKIDLRDIKRAWFSDTFLFYQKDDESPYPLRIAGAAAQFFRSMLEKSIAMRGCLAHGEFYAGPEGELFGPALIAAYEEAEAQDWLGFIIHPSAEKRMEQLDVNGRSATDVLDHIRYPVPFKQRGSHGVKTPQPNEANIRLVYTISPHRDTSTFSDWWTSLGRMQRDADNGIVKAHDATTCPACENERARVHRKYENTKAFIKDTKSMSSDSGGAQR